MQAMHLVSWMQPDVAAARGIDGTNLVIELGVLLGGSKVCFV